MSLKEGDSFKLVSRCIMYMSERKATFKVVVVVVVVVVGMVVVEVVMEVVVEVVTVVVCRRRCCFQNK